MLRKCVGDKSSPYRFNCGDDPMRQEMPEDVKETARMNDIAIQRGFSFYNVDNHNVNTFSDKKPIKTTNDFLGKFGYEGFQNKDVFITDNGLGESSVPKGQCPMPSRDFLQMVQKCIGCAEDK